MAWYYVTNGASQGPIPEAEMRDLHARNVVTADTAVWTDGMPEWTPYAQSALAVGSEAAALDPNARVVAEPGRAVHRCAECGGAFPEGEMLNYEGQWVCAACKPVFFQRLKEGVSAPGMLILASIGSRWMAIIIDYFAILLSLAVLVGIPVALLGSIVVGPNHQTLMQERWFNVPVILVYVAIPFLYEILFIGRFGATPGKMAMGVRVVTPAGQPITYGRSTGRFFAKLLSRIIIYIGYLMAVWDDEKRTLHDRLADTRVITTRQR